MEKEDRQAGTKRRGGLAKLFLAGLGALVFSRVFASGARDGEGADSQGERKFRRLILQGWLIVCGVSLAFVAYGFFAFLVIGDKGPPDWDYGAVPDVPGQSIYSTYPFSEGALEPEPQHVDQRPAGQTTALPKEGPPPSGREKRQESEK